MVRKPTLFEDGRDRRRFEWSPTDDLVSGSSGPPAEDHSKAELAGETAGVLNERVLNERVLIWTRVLNDERVRWFSGDHSKAKSSLFL